MPFFKQDTRYSCGPTALEMMMAYFKVRLGEEKLGRRLKVTKRYGTRNGKLIDAARKAGFYVYVNDEATIEEVRFFLRQRLPVLVNFLEPYNNEGHFTVITGLEEEQIIMNDPWNGKGFKMKIRDFVRRWESEDRRHKKWMMVIAKDDFRLGREFGPIRRTKARINQQTETEN